MKRLVLVLVGTILLTGCAGGAKEDVTCKIGGKDAVFTLKDGIVVEYTFNDAKMSQNVIDNINGEYFTSSTNNTEGKVAVKAYVESVNGSCD